MTWNVPRVVGWWLHPRATSFVYTFSCIFFPPIICFNFSNLKEIICPSKLCDKKYRLPYSFTSKRPSYLFTSSIDWKTIPCLRMRAYFLCLPFSAVRVCHIYLLLPSLCFYIPAGVLNGGSHWPSLERRRNASCSAKNEGLLISKIWVWYLKAWILLAMDFIERKDNWRNK